ncbi:hypothetical protein [Paenibacillus algorifonticola]|uniref:hypothetical protein n=1 Tax=Paenibacillus algorifonticola TaxID=684063 RepID=UPI001C430736|nr:hypothetical protein [Paenibacillus algorifonticola]
MLGSAVFAICLCSWLGFYYFSFSLLATVARVYCFGLVCLPLALVTWLFWLGGRCCWFLHRCFVLVQELFFYSCVDRRVCFVVFSFFDLDVGWGYPSCLRGVWLAGFLHVVGLVSFCVGLIFWWSFRGGLCFFEVFLSFRLWIILSWFDSLFWLRLLFLVFSVYLCCGVVFSYTRWCALLLRNSGFWALGFMLLGDHGFVDLGRFGDLNIFLVVGSVVCPIRFFFLGGP